jgi:ATP-dependent protease ClpP protease subunit
MNEPFYRFRAEAVDEPASAELLIFAPIGDWEDMGELGARAFAKDLSKLPTSVKRLDIHINSPGGSVSEAQAIYSRLADHRSDKHVYIDGLAASAATIIAMVGHKIYIRANANMMIHLPSALAFGNADDMQKVISALDSITESMLNIYAKRTKLEREEIRSLMSAETWFSPQQAVEKGFADEMRGVVKAAAMIDEKHVMFNGVTFDLSQFKNVPAFTATQTPTESETMKEKKPASAAAGTPTEDPENGNGDEGKGKETSKPPTPPEPPTKPKTGEATDDATTVQATAHAAGVKAERDRVTALQALDRPATHEIIVKAIAEGKTVNDVVAECMSAMDKAGAQNARRADARALDGIPGSNDDGENRSGFGGLIAKKVQSRLKGRRSFSRN